MRQKSDKLSKDAAQAAGEYTRAKLVFQAHFDKERNVDWTFGHFRYYEVNGEKYFAEPEDFPFGFDINSIDWDGDVEECGTWMHVHNSTTEVYLVGDFQFRKMPKNITF